MLPAGSSMRLNSQLFMDRFKGCLGHSISLWSTCKPVRHGRDIEHVSLGCLGKALRLPAAAILSMAMGWIGPDGAGRVPVRPGEGRHAAAAGTSSGTAGRAPHVAAGRTCGALLLALPAVKLHAAAKKSLNQKARLHTCPVQHLWCSGGWLLQKALGDISKQIACACLASLS